MSGSKRRSNRDALPFYRQEQQFKRYGVEINRSSMCGWEFKTAGKL